MREIRVITVRTLLLAGITACAAGGCRAPAHHCPSIDHRILPPPGASLGPPSGMLESSVKPARADLPAADPAPATPPGEHAPQFAEDRRASVPLSLPDAIALAHRLQPRLRVFLEGVAQAQGAERVALAPFLPTAIAGASVGGFHLNAGGEPVQVQGGVGIPNFTFIPIAGTVPFGLDLKTGYELAELRVQWLLADFGRRMGRYRQAELGADIAQLQTDRAYQTVANDVAVAFYQVLRAQSLKRIADESVRRAQEDLDVAKKLEKGGVIEKEKVLRAEVTLSQAQRVLDAAEAAVGIGVAGLNLVIGLNVSAPTEVTAAPDLPEFGLTLADCLGQAVSGR